MPSFARDDLADGSSTSQMQLSRVPWAKIGAGLYGLSLVLPAAVINVGLFRPKHETVLGAQCLFQGFLVIFPWLANPFFAIAGLLLAVRRYEFAVLAATCALAFASTTFFFTDIDLRVGAYVWLASIACVFIGACVKLVSVEDANASPRDVEPLGSEAQAPAPATVAEPRPDPRP